MSSKIFNFAYESRADGGGEHARQRNNKKRDFHATLDSEILTPEY